MYPSAFVNGDWNHCKTKMSSCEFCIKFSQGFLLVLALSSQHQFSVLGHWHMSCKAVWAQCHHSAAWKGHEPAAATAAPAQSTNAHAHPQCTLCVVPGNMEMVLHRGRPLQISVSLDKCKTCINSSQVCFPYQWKHINSTVGLLQILATSAQLFKCEKSW